MEKKPVNTRLIWAVAALVAILGQSAVAGEAANKVRVATNHAKNMAVPNGFKTAQGFAAVDANKGIHLAFDGPATAAVAKDSVTSRFTTH
jgi:hypothetical protein